MVVDFFIFASLRIVYINSARFARGKACRPHKQGKNWHFNNYCSGVQIDRYMTEQEVKDKLHSYKKLKKEIRAALIEIGELQEKSYSLRGAELRKLSSSVSTSASYEEVIASKLELEEAVAVELDRLEAMKAELLNLAGLISDLKSRLAFSAYYLHDCSAAEIAEYFEETERYIYKLLRSARREIAAKAPP